MKKLLFVYNPNAGKARIRTALADVIDTFTVGGYEVTARPTQKKGDATRILRAHADEYDRLAVCGGDGTMNEAVRGLLLATDDGKRVAELGYIPAGSTNDFASSLGIPSDPVRAAQIAAKGTPFRCDAGSFNGKPFVYVAAFGAFTEVSYATPQQTKNALGHFAYILEGIKSLPQIRGIPCTVTADSAQLTDNYLYGMVSNSTSVAGIDGIYSDTHVALDDGLLEVMLVREARSLAEKSELMSDLLWANLSSKFITVLKTKKISFSAAKAVPWTLDGEFGGKTATAQIDVLRHAYRIVIPKTHTVPSLTEPVAAD